MPEETAPGLRSVVTETFIKLCARRKMLQTEMLATESKLLILAEVMEWEPEYANKIAGQTLFHKEESELKTDG